LTWETGLAMSERQAIAASPLLTSVMAGANALGGVTVFRWSRDEEQDWLLIGARDPIERAAASLTASGCPHEIAGGLEIVDEIVELVKW
jgi:hypothetical protein